MSKIAIIYHSGYGHTKVLADAVAEGARQVAGTSVDVINVEEFEKRWDTLNQADAIIFGAPTYMGSAPAPFKAFMDASSKLWYERKWKDKIAAGFTNSGSQSGDKLNTLIQFFIFAMQHGMIWVGLDLLPGNNSSKGSESDLNRIGSFAGAMAQSNIDEGAEKAPPESDRKTASLLGKRVAEIANKFKKESTLTNS